MSQTVQLSLGVGFKPYALSREPLLIQELVAPEGLPRPSSSKECFRYAGAAMIASQNYFDVFYESCIEHWMGVTQPSCGFFAVVI